MTVFYGWIVVGVGMLISCIGMGSISALGVFQTPMAEAMGWSRTGISTAALFNFLAAGAGALLWGALSDRFGTRAVVASGGALLGVGLVLTSQVASLGQFQLVFGLVVGLGAASFFTPLTATTTRWFTKNRSLAVSLVVAGSSAGVMIMGPVASYLIAAYDWRTAMLVLGGLVWAIVVPASLFLREPAAAQGITGTAMSGSGELTAAQALRTPQFAAIAATFFACCATHSGPIFHMVAHAMDHGIHAMAAATIMSAASLASLGGKLLCGVVADRVGAKNVLVGGLALQAVVVNLYMFTTDLSQFYAVSALFGFAYGGVMPLYAVLLREYFGARIMGTLLGAAGLASTLGMALGPPLGGYLYDAYGSYSWMFVGATAIGIGAAAIAMTVRPPLRLSPALPGLGAAH